MKKNKLNFIVTTMNGYIIEHINLADYENESANDIINKLFEKTFTSKHIGEFNYVNDIRLRMSIYLRLQKMVSQYQIQTYATKYRRVTVCFIVHYWIDNSQRINKHTTSKKIILPINWHRNGADFFYEKYFIILSKTPKSIIW